MAVGSKHDGLQLLGELRLALLRESSTRDAARDVARLALQTVVLAPRLRLVAGASKSGLPMKTWSAYALWDAKTR